MVFAYVKTAFVPQEQAVISIEERGFRFGDGVFETIRIHDYVPYQWELHVSRLVEGLHALKIEASIEKLLTISKELIQKNELREGFLRISLSRGIGSSGYLPTQSNENTVTLVVETMPLGFSPTDPVDMWVSNIQKVSSRALPVHAKLMQAGNMILSRMEAAENNCFESLVLGDRTQICEGSSCNIFWYHDKTLFTPSMRSGIVPGTTRDAIIRISPFKVKQGLFLLKDILQAEEVFLTNVAWQVVPVKALYPVDKTWDSFDISTLFKKLLNQDIASYAAARKKDYSAEFPMG